MIPGRVRGGWVPWAANAATFIALVAGTQVIARQGSPWDPTAWAVPWSGDVVLALGTLLFLGLAFTMPLHSGVLNVGIYAQFLAGFLVAAAVGRVSAIDPSARAAMAALGGTVAGAFTGALIGGLKGRFAVHEVLSGLLLAGMMAPVARALPLAHATLPALTAEPATVVGSPPWTPGLGLSNDAVLAGAVAVLIAGIVFAFAFARVLRGSAPGFDLRIVGSNPLAAVAAGVEVDWAQRLTLIAGGACAGLTGAIQIWTASTPSLERWPVPLAFAGITVAVYGMGSIRGVLLASALFGAWLCVPGTPVFLGDPGWTAAVAFLLLLPALWVLPRLLPDQGAPRALWRTRHRETY